MSRSSGWCWQDLHDNMVSGTLGARCSVSSCLFMRTPADLVLSVLESSVSAVLHVIIVYWLSSTAALVALNHRHQHWQALGWARQVHASCTATRPRLPPCSQERQPFRTWKPPSLSHHLCGALLSLVSTVAVAGPPAHLGAQGCAPDRRWQRLVADPLQIAPPRAAGHPAGVEGS